MSLLSVAPRGRRGRRAMEAVSDQVHTEAVHSHGGTAMTSPARRPNRGLSWLAVIGFSCVSACQVCLAIGVPWGRAAWSGGSRTLEGPLRVHSAVAACLMAAGAAIAISAL